MTIRNVKRNKNRPSMKRGAYIQGSTLGGAKKEGKELADANKLESWNQLK